MWGHGARGDPSFWRLGVWGHSAKGDPSFWRLGVRGHGARGDPSFWRLGVWGHGAKGDPSFWRLGVWGHGARWAMIFLLLYRRPPLCTLQHPMFPGNPRCVDTSLTITWPSSPHKSSHYLSSVWIYVQIAPLNK